MKPIIYQLDPFDYRFPPVHLALTDPDGLLAFGGDLSPERLMSAYQSGIFPWFSDGEPIMWWSPEKRGVLVLDEFYENRSFKKFLKKNPFKLSLNKAFESVIANCSAVERPDEAGTWITGEMIQAYIRLHHIGYAHSIEVWHDQTLVGGLYGIVVGNLFCGESMFHLQPYASKVAYRGLVKLMQSLGSEFIDCQMQNDFLKTLGVSEMPRELYLKKLADAKRSVVPDGTWLSRDLEFE